GLSLHVDGCDVSPHAVAHARQRAARSGARVGFTVLDALADELPTGYDVVTSSLLLHHLTDDRAVQLLRKMARAADRLVLINDLRRSVMGLVLAYVGTRLLTRSSVVHTDGPRSVHAAFTIDEVLRHAQQAGLEGEQVKPCWPFRYVLSWSRP
ncbi:MAG: methyltransferase domain-containing protein, partial [Phycisphaeraceae bacterium]